MTRASIAPLALLVALTLAAPGRAAAKLPKVGGWKLASPSSYDRKSLYHAINGGAEVYLAYGFRRLLQGEYKRAKLEVTVQLYEMDARLAAFGVFRQQRSAGAKRVAGVTAETAHSSYECLAHKGRTFVKTYATAGKLDLARCGAMLKALLRGISGATALPPALALLPSHGRVPGSIKYAPRAFLGLRELGGALHARYKGNKGKLRLFLLLPAHKKGSAARWRKLGSRWKKASGSTTLRYRKIPYRGVVALKRTAKGIYGAAGAGDLPATSKVLKRVPSSGP